MRPLEHPRPLKPDAPIEATRRRRLRLAAVTLAVATAGGAACTALGDAWGAATTRSHRGSAVATRCPPGRLGTVAFVHGGALSVLDLKGCTTRELVHAHAQGPLQFSHDGRYVAFAGGYVATRGGAVRRTRGSGTWSPRADVLAVATPKGGLRLVDAHGGSRRLLPDGWGVLTVAFARDGRTLAVSRTTFRGPTAPRPWHQEIWLVDVATGARRLIFHLPPKEVAPAWLEGFSPDGRWLLYWQDSYNSASIAADGLPLLALPLAGGKPVTVTRGELHYPDFLTWCGNRLVYVIDHGGRSVTDGDGIAAASPPAWRSQTILPTGGATSWNSIACPTAPAAARGGGGLVVAAGPTSDDSPFGQEHRSLWLVSPTGGTPRRLAETVPPKGETDELPMWSGDGRWILFVRTSPGDAAGRGSLYALDPFGGNLVGPLAPIGRTGNYYGFYGWFDQLDWHR